MQINYLEYKRIIFKFLNIKTVIELGFNKTKKQEN